MDLLRTMMANRKASAVVVDIRPTAPERSGKKKSKPEPPSSAPGSRAMRQFIIEEKPSKKIVREHMKAIIDRECESDSESE